MLKLFEVEEQSRILLKPQLICYNRLVKTHKNTLKSLFFSHIVLINIVLDLMSERVNDFSSPPTLKKSC